MRGRWHARRCAEDCALDNVTRFTFWTRLDLNQAELAFGQGAGMDVRESEPGFRYWAFISYSHQDQAWGRWLHRALETYRIPSRLVGQPVAAGTIPARLAPVFRDRDELPTATDLDRTVAEALRQSWSLVVVCSPASAQSRWVNEEVREFQRLGRADRIHCLLVDGHPDDAHATCFPPALRERPWGEQAVGEPIAADARRSGDGKASARLKLVAGILGVSFDKLVQRDHQRGYRRIALVAVAAVLALVVLSTFTVVAITSRRDALAQRSHAEGLVEFMLGDLRTRLAPEGRLATLDAVGKEALDYYAAQDPAKLDADALARRARALRQIGEIYHQRGHLDDALKVFKEAADDTAALLARDEANSERVFDHAQSMFWVGQIARQRGNNDSAEASFREYMALAERLLGIDPDNAKWQAEAGYATTNLGILLLDAGRFSEATPRFEHALAVADTLARASPADIERQLVLAQTHAWLADARLGEGRVSDAVAERNREVGIYEDILAKDPSNREAADGLVVADRELGKLALARGFVAQATAQARRAVERAKKLQHADPDDARSLEQLAAAEGDLAQALLVANDLAAAGAAAAQAQVHSAQLVARDESVVRWQLRLARSLLLQAKVDAVANKDTLGILRRVQGVLRRVEALGESNRADASSRLLYAEAHWLAGSCNAALGNRMQARENWQQVVDTLAGQAPAASPQADAVLSAALSELGREADAKVYRARLATIGYRREFPGCVAHPVSEHAGGPA